MSRASPLLRACRWIPQTSLLHSVAGIRYDGSNGEVAERSKAHAWKACRRETVSRVRIPVSPPFPRARPIAVSARHDSPASWKIIRAGPFASRDAELPGSFSSGAMLAQPHVSVDPASCPRPIAIKRRPSPLAGSASMPAPTVRPDRKSKVGRVSSPHCRPDGRTQAPCQFMKRAPFAARERMAWMAGIRRIGLGGGFQRIRAAKQAESIASRSEQHAFEEAGGRSAPRISDIEVSRKSGHRRIRPRILFPSPTLRCVGQRAESPSEEISPACAVAASHVRGRFPADELHRRRRGA